MEDPQAFPYPVNAMAQVFPPLSRREHDGLVLRISRHGYHPPVILWKGEVVFGVHLLTAYGEADVEPRFETVPDEMDPSERIAAEATPGLVMDNNARAVVAALASRWSTPGRPRREENCANLQNNTRGAMAEMYAVSVRQVNSVVRVLSEAGPGLRQAVLDWKVKASDAEAVLKLDPAVQEQAVALVMSGEARTVKRAAEHVQREMAEAQEQAAMTEALAKPLDKAVILQVAQVAEMLQLVTEAGVDAIITNPPQGNDQLYLCSDLAALAARILKPTGFLAVVGNGMLLPQMLRHLEHEGLNWVMEGDLYDSGPPAGSGRPYSLAIHRRPLFIFGKPAFQPRGVSDFFQIPAPEKRPAGMNLNDLTMTLIVERLCRPGQVICDPLMLDRASTALAARKLGCTFVGGVKDEDCRNRIHARLVTVEEHRAGVEAAVEADEQ